MSVKTSIIFENIDSANEHNSKIVWSDIEDGKNSCNIFLLAKAFLSIESMTHKKLQKLCYYAKAWYLALMWTLHESYTKDHFAPLGARSSAFQKDHQFP